MVFNNFKHIAPFILILFISFLILFKAPYNASNFDMVPDSVEYALGGNIIATEGSYTITVNGTQFPPRYPPWFSLLVIAPTYIIIGNEIGNAIFAITFFAVLGIAIAFLIGNKISGELGGIIAALGLLLIPTYRILGRQIMTDVPCVSLILLIFYLYLILRPSTLSNNINLYTIVGIIIGFCSALRPPCVSTILPFLIVAFSSKRIRVSLARSFYLLAPSIIFIFATLIYNYYTFNSIFRNGYNFWCPVPYDYLSLTFSTKYILRNLKSMFSIEIQLILMIIVAIFCLTRIKIFSKCFQHMKVPFKTILEFMILGIGPLIVFLFIIFLAK
jgi:4-amino-4-deoxy-L-arabinose transferase-like glycosyltransferase